MSFRLSFLLLFAFSLFFMRPGLSGGRADHYPVQPETIAEYDTVAGVVMYWNPGSASYDAIVAAVINGIQPQATVYLQTNGDYHREQMTHKLSQLGVPMMNIVFINVTGDRIWIRDHGPFSIYDDGQLAFVGFNDLATNHGDQDLSLRLADYWDLNHYWFPHIIFDGGNYLVDSHNRLFATNRLFTNNSCYPPDDIRATLSNYMGIEETFLFQALSSDYWGHIDMQIKLLNDTTFIISSVDPSHPDHAILEANYQMLLDIEHPEGKTYQVVKIPKAENWKTYINSLIVNEHVLVPIYNNSRDGFALETYASLMPGKTIIGIDCNAMIHWEGAIHCITNQIPPFTKVQDEEDDGDDPDEDDGEDDDGEDDDADEDEEEGDATSLRESDSNVNDYQLEVFPNPASGLVNARFEINSPGSYHFRAISLSGQLLIKRQIDAWFTGTYHLPFDVSAWPAGQYIIQLEGQNATGSRLLLKTTP